MTQTIGEYEAMNPEANLVYLELCEEHKKLNKVKTSPYNYRLARIT